MQPQRFGGALDNVEDLLTDVITSPRFDSEVFTLERSLQEGHAMARELAAT